MFPKVFQNELDLLKSGMIKLWGLKSFEILIYSSSDAGLTVDLSGLTARYRIGIVGHAGDQGSAQQDRLFVGMALILIFCEMLGLYGLIVTFIFGTKAF